MEIHRCYYQPSHRFRFQKYPRTPGPCFAERKSALVDRESLHIGSELGFDSVTTFLAKKHRPSPSLRSFSSTLACAPWLLHVHARTRSSSQPSVKRERAAGIGRRRFRRRFRAGRRRRQLLAAPRLSLHGRVAFECESAIAGDGAGRAVSQQEAVVGRFVKDLADRGEEGLDCACESSEQIFQSFVRTP